MERGQTASSNLMDNHNRLVANVLTHYRALMMLATVQAEGDRSNGTPEAIAVAGISIKTEFDGLYTSIKELLTLSRRIKELWVFGPLGREDPGQRDKEAQIDADVARVGELLERASAAGMRDAAEREGGSWEAPAVNL